MVWYGDSKAIIVGAGGVYPGGTYPEGDLQRLSFSSFGSRFDVQGWGENVVTTGWYGDLYNIEGKPYWFTNSFSGTSSASPIVAGGAACLVAYYRHNVFNLTLSPSYIRGILAGTGTPQVTPPVGNIGPRPNLLTAISVMGGWVDAASGTPVSDGVWNTAWGDYDNDGDYDFYALRGGSPNKLFRNDTYSFTDVTATPLNVQNAISAKWGDYDNDGDLDLYATRGSVGNKLFRNDGGGTFTDVTSGPLADMGQCTNAAWGDYDRDGDIDLYIAKDFGQANRLLRNDGGGMFVDATSAPLAYAGYGVDVSWVDYDNDNDVDLYVVNNNQANKLFRNDGNGVFADVTGPIIGDAGSGMAAAWGDFDNDGDLDVYLSNASPTPTSKLIRNDGGGNFTDVTNLSVFNARSARGASWGDFDNDGDLDLFVACMGDKNKLFRNDYPTTVFTEVAPIIVVDSATYSLGAAWTDYDKDGRLDVSVGDIYFYGRLFKNNVPNYLSHWLKVALIGTVSNSSSYGAHVRIVIGGVSQMREIGCGTGYQSQSPLPVHFGLGGATTVDSVIAKWPSGTTRSFASLPVDTLLEIRESDPVCGDADGSGIVNISDVVYLIAYVFSGGPAPNPTTVGDVDCNGIVNISDVVYLIAYIFIGSPAPCASCK